MVKKLAIEIILNMIQATAMAKILSPYSC